MAWLAICTVAFLVGGLIVVSERWHGFLTEDNDFNKPQARHTRPTPRVGGLAVLAGSLSGVLLLGPENMTIAWLWPALFVAALPVFVAGLLEDITKDIGVSKRLLAAFVSAAIAWWLLGGINRIGITYLDEVFSFWPVSLILTVIAVGGCTHALNIVDGMNGLAGMVTVLMALSIAIVALQVGDLPIVMIAAALSSATLGFLVWNFPFGRVFLGDGGAYFLGFMLAELAILLVVRNQSVSPFYALAVLFYPVFETVFSMWRRRFKGGLPVGQPDALHLHQLVFQRLVRGAAQKVSLVNTPDLKNAVASSYMWLLALIGLVPATIWWENSWLLAISLTIFMSIYVWLYRRLMA